MEDWQIEARRLRHEGATIEAIRAAVRKEQNAVYEAVRDIPVNHLAWRDTARDMRIAGASVKQIMAAVGRKRSIVSQALKGIAPPPRPKQEKPPKPVRQPRPRKVKEKKGRAIPAWWAEARALWLDKIEAKVIAAKVGKSPVMVRKVCKDLPKPERVRPPKPPKPVRERKPRREPSWWALARALAQEGLSYDAIAEKVGKHPTSVRPVVADVYCYVRPAKPKPQRAPQRTPEQKREDARKAKIKMLIARDRQDRAPAPVTLPRLSFLL